MNNEDGVDLAVDFVVGQLSFKDVVQIIKGKTYRKSSWKIWLDKDGNEVSQESYEFGVKKGAMMVREESNIAYVAKKNVDKTKEEATTQVFAGAIPFDKEAFGEIVKMYYDTFKELVNR